MNNKSNKMKLTRKGWKETDTYSWCPIHRKIVKCVIVNWMHNWLRCPECLLKLPSKYNFDEPYTFIGAIA